MLVASAGRGFGAVIPEVGGAKPEETSRRRGVCTVMSSLWRAVCVKIMDLYIMGVVTIMGVKKGCGLLTSHMVNHNQLPVSSLSSLLYSR